MATTHTTSSPLPWNRNGVETGGPVRIGQVHTCTGLSHYLFVGAHGLWENSAAVQTRLGRARTVSRLQGYPVSRANEPRELPYVRGRAYPRRKDRPRITGSQWPTIFFPTGFQRASSARGENGSIGSPPPPRASQKFEELRTLLFSNFFSRCFSNVSLVSLRSGELFMRSLEVKKKVVQITSFFFESKFNAVKFSSGE